MHLIFFAFIAVAIAYGYLLLNTHKMADETNKHPDQDELIVDIGGKKVPWSSVNKPHTRILEADKHKPVPNPDTFPDIEPDAKKREEQLAAERRKNN